MENKEKSYIIIGEAKPQGYLRDFVALPENYGSAAYYAREDVKEIRRVVFESLDALDARIGLNEKIAGRRVIIKPNLVAVFHNAGFKVKDMPQSTDPRVFEAVVDYMTRFTDKITLAESTGGQLGTTAYFKIVGLDRIAKRYNAELVAFENMPIDRYILPKAEIMKEVAVPRLLSEVVRGEAYYVSVPKMKTNAYTGVTLGFKNAMGTIPTHLRYRNHSYQIEKKLVDLLYLFKPDLVVIDGIVGAEGVTPGPVDPVDSRMVVVSNHSVEADRLTTDMMGIGSKTNQLIIEAVSRGYDDPEVEIIGTPRYLHFRPADKSMLSERFMKNWPKIKLLVGLTPNNDKHLITDIHSVTPEIVREMEGMCGGGCLPAVSTILEMYLYAKKPVDIELAVFFGRPVLVNGKEYYFDGNGKPYDRAAIKALPMRKLAIGECTRSMRDAATIFSGGCVDVGRTTLAIMAATRRLVPMFSLGNKGVVPMFLAGFQTVRIRRKLIDAGEYVDLPYDQKDHDKIHPIPELSDEDMQKDYLPWPFPPMTAKDKRRLKRDVKIV
ncbi:MAG: DUF362 domain-containing protein [Oscillospiraceae bacterium]|nr:DUF362 domain-containing protein [Oscillospiraceae bacterium]